MIALLWSTIIIFAWQHRLFRSILVFILCLFNSCIANLLQAGTACLSSFQFIRKLICKPASRFLKSSSKKKDRRRPLRFDVISALKVAMSRRRWAVVIKAIACSKNSLSTNNIIVGPVCHTGPSLFLHFRKLCDHRLYVSFTPRR